MALSPKDIALDYLEQKEATELESYLDKELQAHGPGQRISIRVKLTHSTRVKNEIVSRYKKAGWTKVEVTGHNTIEFYQ